MSKEANARAEKQNMTMKSFLLTCGIFCGGYVSNTVLDSALDAVDSYFHFQTSTYKTDSNGYIICSLEQPNQGLLKKSSSQNASWEDHGKSGEGLKHP